MWNIVRKNSSGLVEWVEKPMAHGIYACLFYNRKAMTGWHLSLKSLNQPGEFGLWLGNIPDSPEITQVFCAADKILHDLNK